VQLTTGLLKTGKHILTNSPCDVRFRDKLSGVYVRRVERGGEGSLLEGRVLLTVRQICAGKLHMANFLRHSFSWYSTLNWTGG
jgi:hypothetical protein